MRPPQPKSVVDLSSSATKSVDTRKMQNLNDTAIINLKKQARKLEETEQKTVLKKKQKHQSDIEKVTSKRPRGKKTDLSDQAIVHLSPKEAYPEQQKSAPPNTNQTSKPFNAERLAELMKDLDRPPEYALETPIHDLSDTAILRLKTGVMRNLRGNIPDPHGRSPEKQAETPSRPSPRPPKAPPVKMEFTKDLETDIEIMDIQHREYFQIMNNLIDECANGMTTTDLREAFHFLDFFTIHHFATEEELMKGYEYPDYPEHHARHQEFRIELNNLKKRFRHEGMTETLVMRLGYLLNEWFTKQVEEDDKKLSNFLRDKSKQNKTLANCLVRLVKNFTHYSK